MKLRLATLNDAPRIAEIYAPAVRDSATSFEGTAPDAAEMARRIAKVLERTPWLVAEDQGRVMGYAYASPHRERLAYQWSVEVSAYVEPSRHRGGVGRMLYLRLFELLQAQGFVNAYAGITLPNPPSEGFHRALGFEPIGIYRGVGFKAGRWHDVVWMHRLIQPPQANPEPPRALPDLPGSAS